MYDFYQQLPFFTLNLIVKKSCHHIQPPISIDKLARQIARYGAAPARLAVPLSYALTYLSHPEPAILDVLNKYSHDGDGAVALNAIAALGLVGAGTNNARLATMLRQLAAYHAKNPSHLFLVRIAQGLVHMGKVRVQLLLLCILRANSYNLYFGFPKREC